MESTEQMDVEVSMATKFPLLCGVASGISLSSNPSINRDTNQLYGGLTDLPPPTIVGDRANLLAQVAPLDDLHEDQSVSLVDACLAQSNLHLPLGLGHNLVKGHCHSSLLQKCWCGLRLVIQF